MPRKKVINKKYTNDPKNKKKKKIRLKHLLINQLEELPKETVNKIY